MSHVREASGCHTPEPKRVKFSEVLQDSDGSEGVDDAESMNGSEVMSQVQNVNHAQSMNESEAMNDAQGVGEIQDVNEAQDVNDAQGMIGSEVMDDVQGVNEAQSVNGSDGGFNMVDLDAALLPLENAPSLDDFEPLGHIETGWEFIQYALQQQRQQVVQEEIVPDQANNSIPAGNIYTGPLFAPRPVYVPYNVLPVPKLCVNKLPEFAALFVGNRLAVPGLTERQSRFLVTYIMNNIYWALPNQHESITESDEEDFEDAIKLHGVGQQYHLPDLAALARQAMINMLDGQVSLQFAINAFKRDRVWYRSNTELIRASVSYRARKLVTYALYLDVQDYTDGHGTSSPIINGLLEALIVLKGQLPGVGDEAEPYRVINSLLD
ncbi:hypothetical protein ACHAQI_002218 [Fusarium lateritium]